MKKILASAMVIVAVSVAGATFGIPGGNTFAADSAGVHEHCAMQTGWWQWVCGKCGYRGSKFKGQKGGDIECPKSGCGGLATAQDCPPPG
jgi:hypothetical protein